MDNIAESLTTCKFANSAKEKGPLNGFSLRLTLLRSQGLVLIELQHKGISSGAKLGSGLFSFCSTTQRALSLEKLRREEPLLQVKSPTARVPLCSALFKEKSYE